MDRRDARARHPRGRPGRRHDIDCGAPRRRFRIASNTKTFTAAAALRLVEDGVLGLDDPIAELVDPALFELLVADRYDPSAITVRQLLGHTSGLYDHASAVDFQVLVLGDPSKRRWAAVHLTAATSIDDLPRRTYAACPIVPRQSVGPPPAPRRG